MLSISEITTRAKAAPKPTREVEVVFNSGLTERIEDLETEQVAVQADIDAIDEDLAAELEELRGDARTSDPRPAAAQAGADEAAAPLKAKLAELQTALEQVQADAADFLVKFRFTALEGYEWNELTARSVPRDDVASDVARGYNLDEVCQIVATRSGVRVLPDGETEELTAEEWHAVWETAPAPALERLKIAVWYLNDYASDRAADAARKASTARTAATSA